MSVRKSDTSANLDGVTKRCSFLNRSFGTPDEWHTTYKDDYRYKSLPRKHKPMSSGEKRLQESPATNENLPGLDRGPANFPAIQTKNECVGRKENYADELEKMCGIDPAEYSVSWGKMKEMWNLKGTADPEDVCAAVTSGLKCGEKRPPRVYTNEMPTVPRKPLPRDILQPDVIVLKAKDWKGVKLPFEDPRFEPMYLADRDTDFMSCTNNPFRYCNRKRKFPEKNRCPNLPIPKEAILKPEPGGYYACMRPSAMPDRRWAMRRFPRPPESFLTRLW